MNGFIKWLEKSKRASDEKKHNLALGISLVLTLFVVYFVLYNWYYKFNLALNPNLQLNEETLLQVENVENIENLETGNIQNILENIKSKFKNFFDNSQTVSR